MVIFEPVDAIQLEKAMPVIRDYNGPVYIRLFRKALPDVFDASYTFDLFKADTIKEGKDVTIFASGIMVQESMEALALLKAAGIDAELINIHTIKPRITSYNVCYTKLLRGLPICSVRRYPMRGRRCGHDNPPVRRIRLHAPRMRSRCPASTNSACGRPDR